MDNSRADPSNQAVISIAIPLKLIFALAIRQGLYKLFWHAIEHQYPKRRQKRVNGRYESCLAMKARWYRDINGREEVESSVLPLLDRIMVVVMDCIEGVVLLALSEQR